LDPKKTQGGHKPLKVQKRKPAKKNDRIDQGYYKSTTKHRPINVRRERNYSEEVEVGNDGEFDEKIIYEHYTRTALSPMIRTS